MPDFPLTLTEKLAAYPLIKQTVFFYSFFYGTEIYKLEINLPFAKNKYSRNKIFF